MDYLFLHTPQMDQWSMLDIYSFVIRPTIRFHIYSYGISDTILVDI